MEQFFKAVLNGVDALATAFTSFRIVSYLDDSELGTVNVTRPRAYNDSLICVLDDRHGTQLRWTAEYNGTPTFGYMHRNGFYIYCAQSRQQDFPKLLLHEITDRCVVEFREKSEDDENNKNQQWNALRVTNIQDAFLIKNVESGRCLWNTGSGRSVTTGVENMTDESMWWRIQK